MLNSLEAPVPRECDPKDNYKLERAAYLLTAAPRAGWNIKPYTDSEKKQAVFNFMSGKMTQQQISSAICMSDSTLRRLFNEVKIRLQECNPILFPVDSSFMNVTQIAKKYLAVDDKGFFYR